MDELLDEDKLGQRYSDLIDKQFLEGLTGAETAELAEINNKLDDLEEAWYEPIYQLLIDLVRRI